MINSHYIYFFGLNDGVRTIAEATIEFEKPIIGLMGDPRPIAVSQSQVSSINYFHVRDGATLEGLNFFNPLDWDYVKVTGENNNVLQLRFTTNRAFESLLVVTDASFQQVPEPLTILGSTVAVIFGAAFKSKL